MPAAVAIPLITSAIAGGSALAGGALAARGANRAAKTQADATDKALAFERDVFNDEKARLEPFRQLGTQAYQQMGQRLGISGGMPSSWGFTQPSTTVRIRHPRTGEVRAVSRAQAERLQARGGQVVP